MLASRAFSDATDVMLQDSNDRSPYYSRFHNPMHLRNILRLNGFQTGGSATTVD